ncbi:hypothetical protein COHA_009142 [Chlorella ohadii]|uniref:6-phosphogluconolactonase n=1 Tax=Chlorella ohadii TaxID=2649997 RepID=A0AAD5DFZ9_9CHLO|nr:hypothetical protein COHA_009142 [Chlorella ohadii]
MAPSNAGAPAPALAPPPLPPAAAEWVVVGGFPDDTSVALMRLDTATGALSRVSTSSVGGVAPAYVAWQQSAAAPADAAKQTGASPFTLYVTNHARNRPGTGITAVRWQAPGSSGGGDAAHSLAAAGSGGFVQVPDPAHAAVSPSGRWVLTASYDGCSLSVVPVLEGGRLGLAATLEEAAVGKAPHEVVFDPSGRFVFVPCLGSDWVRCFSFDDATGTLSPLGRPGRDSRAAAELLLSPDGRFLYASNRGSQGGHNSIAVFGVCPSSGRLAPLAWETGGGAVDFPRHMSLAAGGSLMLVANQHSDSVAVFRRSAASGLLSLASVCSTAGAVAQPTFAGVVPWPA